MIMTKLLVTHCNAAYHAINLWEICQLFYSFTDISLRACIDESSLGCGPVAALDQSESLFFNELIERYLFPIEGDRNHQKKCEQQLKVLIITTREKLFNISK